MPTWVSPLVGIGVMTLLVVAFIISYKLNKKTPVPKGCEDLTSDCDGCAISSCTLHVQSKDKVEVI
jgi:hypothetical protein